MPIVFFYDSEFFSVAHYRRLPYDAFATRNPFVVTENGFQGLMGSGKAVQKACSDP